MQSTLKSYFLGGFGEGLCRRTVRTSSKDLPKQAKKTALRLDGVQIPLGYWYYIIFFEVFQLKKSRREKICSVYKNQKNADLCQSPRCVLTVFVSDIAYGKTAQPTILYGTSVKPFLFAFCQPKTKIFGETSQ